MCSLYRKVVFDQPVVLKIFVDVTTAKKSKSQRGKQIIS